MRLSDTVILCHLNDGGKIKLKTISWAYAKLNRDQLWWFDISTDKFVGCVEAFTEVVSKNWEIFEDEDFVRRQRLSPAIRSKPTTNGSYGGYRGQRDSDS